MSTPLNTMETLTTVRAIAIQRERETATAPGQRWVPVTIAQFEEVLAPLGFERDAATSAKTGQVVFRKQSRIDATVFILVYTTVPTNGSTVRAVGEDSIKVALVREVEAGRFRPLIKKLPYACRTRGWRTVLLDRLEEQMRKFGKACATCGAATMEREGKFGTFHGCVRFPECKGYAAK